jgi:hypothetical protein
MTTDHNDAILWQVAEHFSESQLLATADSGMELSVSLSNDAHLAATSGDAAGVFDGESGSRLYRRDLPLELIASPCVLAQFWLSPQGTYAAGAGYEYAVGVYDTVTFNQIAHVPSASCSAAVAFNQAETLMATSEPALYRTRDWQRIWPTDDPAVPDAGVAFTGLDDPWVIEQVQFTPDEQQLVVSKCIIYAACDFHFYDVRTGVTREHFSVNLSPESNAWPQLSVSPGGRWWLVGRELIDVGGENQSLSQPAVTGIFTPNGDIIASDDQGMLTRHCRTPL